MVKKIEAARQPNSWLKVAATEGLIPTEFEVPEGAKVISHEEAQVMLQGIPEAAKLAVVGKSRPYIDGVERVTGTAKFTQDIILPEMAYARVLRSPYPHAKVTRLDTSKAEALPGVLAVLTPEDVPNTPLRPGKLTLTDEPKYVGDEIAAVAAVDETTAEEALDLIEVEFEELPFVLNPEEAMKDGAPRVHPEGNVVSDYQLERGHIEEGFAQADVIVEGRYVSQKADHVTMEPHIVIARWEGDKLTLWTSTQYTHGVRDDVAKVLGIPQGKVNVICDYMGGGYGDKGGNFAYHPIAALLARKAGRPVRLEYTREEVLINTNHGYPVIQELKVGAKKDGTLTAIQSKAIEDNGAYSITFGFYTFAQDALSPARVLYRCPNVKLEGYDVYTNSPVAGFKRSVGEPQGNFALEVHMDRVAAELGMDPLEFRLKNVVRPEDGDQDRDIPFSSIGIEECLRKGAESFDWQGTWKKRGLGSEGPRRRGVGMAALASNKGGTFPPHSAMVKVNFDGSVQIVVGIADLGGGQRTQMAMIAAEALGVKVEDVSVSMPDTEFTSDTGVTAGSRATKSIGVPVMLAALDAKRQVMAGAAKLLEVEPDELTARAGEIFITDNPSKKITFAEAASQGGFLIGGEAGTTPVGTPIIGRATWLPPRDVAQNTFAAGFAEVEVDVETGAVEVLRLVQAHDVGKAINPDAVKNQIEGGAIMGISLALLEDLILDEATGIPVTAYLTDYKIPTHEDIPEIEAIIVESDDSVGPFGAKGIGEPPIDLAAPAIANAIYNATGARVHQIPMTPAKVLAALKEA